MAKKGVKIKDLARELGVNSRTLLDRCRVAGWAVQNSVTKLTSDQVRQATDWFPKPSPSD